MYVELFKRQKFKQRSEQQLYKAQFKSINPVYHQMQNSNASPGTPMFNPSYPSQSYASILKQSPSLPNTTDTSSLINKLTETMLNFMTMLENNMRIMMQSINALTQIMLNNK